MVDKAWGNKMLHNSVWKLSLRSKALCAYDIDICITSSLPVAKTPETRTMLYIQHTWVSLFTISGHFTYEHTRINLNC